MNNTKLLLRNTTQIFSKKSFSSKQKCNYQILGLKPDATSADIKNAYYQKSKKYHPDINKDPKAEGKFLEINLAYEILSNEYSRNDYDKSRGYSSPSQSNTQATHTTTMNQRNHDFDTLYTRNIYRRMKLREMNKTRASSSTSSSTANHKTWQQQLDEEEKFYQSLDETLKHKYDEYFFRVKQEYERKQQQEEKENHAGVDPNSISSESKIIFLITMIIFMFFINTVSGTFLSSDQSSNNSSLPKHRSKND